MKLQILSTSLCTLLSICSLNAFAAEDPDKSTNVKATLISNCKEAVTAPKGLLTSTEAVTFCQCHVEADGRLTTAQKWEITSTVNQNQDPSTLSFVQQTNKSLDSCLGPQLVTKLKNAAKNSNGTGAAN